MGIYKKEFIYRDHTFVITVNMANSLLNANIDDRPNTIEIRCKDSIDFYYASDFNKIYLDNFLIKGERLACDYVNNKLDFSIEATEERLFKEKGFKKV